ncbi:antibiotic biosynthesis monooxygenase [Polaromonas hydrogenivorans]|uniref:Antibiotic biosynthesis monooxygenase n=1 Tax=Polaromonas hydrogenivorans TaxID=335476 RepID=A0AAU7LN07_9BURK
MNRTEAKLPASTGQQTDASPESISFIVQHRVRADAQAAYETWLAETMRVAGSFAGHQGVHVVRPAAGSTSYTIVVRFATYEEATRWHQSDERARLVEALHPYLESGEQVSIGAGIDYWFQPRPAAPGEPPMKPPAWKQWLITTSVIWPLTMIVPWLFRPVFRAAPLLGMYGVAHVIIASVIVALVVWVIMPRYTQLVHGWLFRKD